MVSRVVFTDHTFDDLELERELFEESALEIELIDGEESDESLEDVVVDAAGVIVMYDEIDGDLIDRMEECRIISRAGIGMDNVDVASATDHGIYVTNVPDYCIDEVSDHTIGLMLALERKIVFYDEQTGSGGWDVSGGRPMRRLSTQTLGLVAFGRTARQVARKASAFGMEVRSWDPYVSDSEIESGGATPVADLDDLLVASDTVSVHPPLTPDTEGLLSTPEFEAMDESAFVLNVARGGIVDEEALASALDAGELAGAAIDVLSQEPPTADHPLVGREDVILTPHVAWNSTESVVELRRKAARNVVGVLEGSVPEYVLNQELSE